MNADEVTRELARVDSERAKLLQSLAILQAEEEASQPKELKKFRHTVRAYGTFVTEAYDMYEADADVRDNYSKTDIILAIGANWSDIEVNDDEFPEEC